MAVMADAFVQCVLARRFLRLLSRSGVQACGGQSRALSRFGAPGLLLFLTLLVTAAQAAPVSRLTGEVVKVMDGDSFLLRAGGKVYEVRLWGVDCPEHGQVYGDQARAAVRKLLGGRNVQVEVVGRDSYARYLGVAYRGKLLVNEELVRQGAAWVYRRFCREEICKGWLEAEAEARQQRRGLWAGDKPLPPWQWRRQ